MADRRAMRRKSLRTVPSASMLSAKSTNGLWTSCWGTAVAMRLMCAIVMVVLPRRRCSPYTFLDAAFRDFDIALVDNRFFNTRDQVLPERHIKRVVLQREKIARRSGAMDICHAAYRCTGKVHRHRYPMAKGHVADPVGL